MKIKILFILALVAFGQQASASGEVIRSIVEQCQTTKDSRRDCYQKAAQDHCDSLKGDKTKCFDVLFNAVAPDLLTRAQRARSCIDPDLGDEVMKTCEFVSSEKNFDSNEAFRCFAKAIEESNVSTYEATAAKMLFRQAADQSSFVQGLVQGCPECGFAKDNVVGKKLTQALTGKFDGKKCNAEKVAQNADAKNVAAAAKKATQNGAPLAGNNQVINTLLACVNSELGKPSIDANGKPCKIDFNGLNLDNLANAGALLSDSDQIEQASRGEKPKARPRADTATGQVVQFFTTIRKHLVSDLAKSIGDLSGSNDALKTLATKGSCSRHPEISAELMKAAEKKAVPTDFPDEMVLKIIGAARKAQNAIDLLCGKGLCYFTSDQQRYNDKMHAAVSLGSTVADGYTAVLPNWTMALQKKALAKGDKLAKSFDARMDELREAISTPYLAIGYQNSLATSKGLLNYYAGFNSNSFPMVSEILEAASNNPGQQIAAVRKTLIEKGRPMAGKAITDAIESACKEDDWLWSGSMPWHQLIAMPNYVDAALEEYGNDPYFEQLRTCALAYREELMKDADFAKKAAHGACIPGAFVPFGPVVCTGIFIASTVSDLKQWMPQTDYQVGCASSGTDRCSGDALITAVQMRSRALDEVGRDALNAFLVAENLAQAAGKGTSAFMKALKSGDESVEKSLDKILKDPKEFGLTQTQAQQLVKSYGPRAANLPPAALADAMAEMLAKNLKVRAAVTDEQALEIAKLILEEGKGSPKYLRLLKSFSEENARMIAKKYKIEDVESFIKISKGLPENSRSLVDIEMLARDADEAARASPKFGKQIFEAAHDPSKAEALEEMLSKNGMPKDASKGVVQLIRDRFRGGLGKVAKLFEKNLGACFK